MVIATLLQGTVVVPNVPCGVEICIGQCCLCPLSLANVPNVPCGVEMRASSTLSPVHSAGAFLMYRMELKALDTKGYIVSVRHVHNVPCGVES